MIVRLGGSAAWALVTLATAAGACGSTDRLPRAAAPARSPELDRRPAGRVLRVGGTPEGLTIDATTGEVAVGLSGPDGIALVDGRTGIVRRRVRLPAAPQHVALARPGGPLLAPMGTAGALGFISLPAGGVRSVVAGPAPHDAVAAAGRVFVADAQAGSVTVLGRGRVVRTLSAPAGPGSLAAADARVAVLGARGRELALFDARTLRTVERVPAGIGPTNVASDGGNRLLVVDTAGDAVLVFRIRPRLQIVRRVALRGGPYAIARGARRDRFWVTLTERNEVVEISGRLVMRRFAAVRQPDAIAVDRRSGRVWVAGRADEALQAIDAGR